MCVFVSVAGRWWLACVLLQLNSLVQINTARPQSVAVKKGVRIQLNYYRLGSGLKCSDLAAGSNLRKPPLKWSLLLSFASGYEYIDKKI